MSSNIEQIKTGIDEISIHLDDFKTTDMPILGIVSNLLETIIKNAKEENLLKISTISESLKVYFESLILEEADDPNPVFEGMELLKAMLKTAEQGKEFSFDISHVEKILNPEKEKFPEDFVKSVPEVIQETQQPVAPEEKEFIKKELEEEDIEVLIDFVAESLDNLETIEINLINLEDNPEDMEIINSIFRPFHTIKGVSGFLDLDKINKLSHCTENLLDGAREGNFTIGNEITDVILESVDILVLLMERIQLGIETNEILDDRDIDTVSIINKINEIEKKSQRSKNMPLGSILVENKSISQEDLEEVLSVQKETPEKKIGEILLEKNKVEPKEIITAIRDQKKSKRFTSSQVKVDTDKLDNLVDLTGELVIAQSILKQNSNTNNNSEHNQTQNLNHLGQIVSSIQKIAMSMRMVPVNNTFQKMVRLVRDLANNSGKKVILKMSGEETEIDRNVVEALYEPMVHMIRNSVDHGLENPEEREESGKDPHGTISLTASHRGGNIVIEIKDNGKGLNKDKILEKAKSSNLIDDNTNLSDSEIYDLIMKPGFSTADKITDISGRGVGMDVVKKAIEDLRGRIDIQSTPGRGSKFIITLPLTLAIIEGILVRVGVERFVIPTMSIVESFRPEKKDYYTVEGKGEMINTRGHLIPLVRLDKIFEMKGDAVNPWDGLVVIVENKNQLKGLLLDELLGKDEYVIKSLGNSFQNVKGFAGGTIMGDGKIGLIFDISELFEFSQEV